MAYENYQDKIENLQHYIRLEHTGSAETLAKKLGVSRRILFKYLKMLRLTGKGIRYSKLLKTYYFIDK
jgi:biotin operon repressor